MAEPKIIFTKPGKFQTHSAHKITIADDHMIAESEEHTQRFDYKNFDDVIIIDANMNCSFTYIIFIDANNKNKPNTNDDFFHPETLDTYHKMWLCCGLFSIKKTYAAGREIYTELKNRFVEFKEKQNAPKEEIIENTVNNSSNEDSNSYSVVDEIRKFKQLKDDGIITEEEFNNKKKELLGL